MTGYHGWRWIPRPSRPNARAPNVDSAAPPDTDAPGPGRG